MAGPIGQETKEHKRDELLKTNSSLSHGNVIN